MILYDIRLLIVVITLMLNDKVLWGKKVVLV